jgi:protein-disulfide isomerase
MNMKIGLAAVALVAVGALGIYGFGKSDQRGQTAIPAASAETTTTTDPAANPAASAVKDFTIGAADARVKIVEYASFTCPHCANFHEENWDKLKAEYIDTGKVLFEYREVYFDRYGLWAAMVARCGGDMRYFGLVETLFEKQKDWVASDDPAVVVENIKTLGRATGMDDAAMDVCLKDQDQAKALVAHFETSMKADAVEGTPTLFINGTKHGNMVYADLKALIEAELAK